MPRAGFKASPSRQCLMAAVVVLVATLVFPTFIRAQPFACEDTASYYSPASGLTGNALKDALHAIIDGHTVIPYTSTATDTWDALSVLDADPANANNVITIYAQQSVPASTSGDTDGWNREHVFPKSYGVGTTGPDTSDLLSLRAADWNVNSARNNLYYGNCDSGCDSPAHVEADPSTAKNSVMFRPPTNVRGDLARSILYMAVRYDGSDPDTMDLEISNSPNDATGRMGLLADILQWHIDDPPDDTERMRNDLVCSQYQHNRNPFIDHPEWVSMIDWNVDGTEPPVTPTPSGPSTLEAGDVAVIAAASDNPDEFVLVLLRPVNEGTQIKVTDNGWIPSPTSAFRTGEGVLTWTCPDGGLSAGVLVVYNSDTPSSDWTEEGSFALSTTGDSLILYQEEDGGYQFLFALDLSGGWETSAGAVTSTTASGLPESLDSFNVVLPEQDNGVFVGLTSGHAEDILLSIMDASNWAMSTSRTGYTTPVSSFSVVPGSSSSSPPTLLLVIIVVVGVLVLIPLCITCFCIHKRRISRAKLPAAAGAAAPQYPQYSNPIGKGRPDDKHVQLA